MKKIILLFIISTTFLILGCFSTISIEQQKKDLIKVLQFESKKQNEIYDNTLAYVARNFRSAKEVITFKDKKNGLIVINGISEFHNYVPFKL